MITSYHRPGTLAEAVALVTTPGTQVIVEGAAVASSGSDEATAAVDLQSLGLDGIDMSGESLEIGSMTTLGLSVDHRVLDGVKAARFLGELRRLLEHPEELVEDEPGLG